MATVINTDTGQGREVREVNDSTSSALGFVLAFIIVLLILGFVLYYGPGLLRGAFNFSASQAPQVNVPGKIDVNINKNP